MITFQNIEANDIENEKKRLKPQIINKKTAPIPKFHQCIFFIQLAVFLLCFVFFFFLQPNTIYPPYPGYRIIAIIKNDRNGIEARLKSLESHDFYKNNTLSPFIKYLTFTVTFDSNNELTLRFTDSKQNRFTLPYKDPFPFTKTLTNSHDNPSYKIEMTNYPFSIKITRKNTNEIIFDNSHFPFIYSDKFLEFSTILPSNHLYGLGERRQGFLYKPGTYTIWPKDQVSMIDNGTGPNHQLYGHHPMYLMREKHGNFHVVFLRNSNAMDCVISKNSKFLTYKIVGGIIEFKLFLGDKKPETAIKLYHTYINGYTLMPFWSMGFHQSRWGYSSSKMLLEVVDNFRNSDIPLDTIWSDIDYMQDFQDFTVNSNFDRKDFEKIFNKSIHWVPIIDFGIHKDLSDNSSIYQIGENLDIFIKSHETNKSLTGSVWPGATGFPDFNHPNISKFWGDQLDNLYQKIPYNGIWLDMNEPCNFNSPSITPFGRPRKKPYVYSKHLPYIPGGFPLEDKTISLKATHFSQGVYINSSKIITELDFHTLNGFLEAKTTYDFLKGNLSQGLPFILSRSNMFGSGAFSFHWTGDNAAEWDFLRSSISEIFNYQLFGIPFTGVDICGFAEPTTIELCSRWMQVGSFYPFARNHNAIYTTSQEPYVWGENSAVFHASRNSLKLRYSILKWYYSVFVRNNGTGTIFKPLFFEFPDDLSLYDLDNEFMIGSEILIAPVLEPDRTTNLVYFTNNTSWFDFFNGSLYYEYDGKFVEVQAPLDSNAPIFIKTGSIVFVQNTTNVTKVSDLSNKFKLKIALDSDLTASGFILGIENYTDDFNILNSCAGKNDCLIKMLATTKIDDLKTNITIHFQKTSENTVIQEIYITEVEVFALRFENINHTLTYYLNGEFLIKDQSSFSFAGQNLSPSRISSNNN